MHFCFKVRRNHEDRHVQLSTVSLELAWILVSYSERAVHGCFSRDGNPRIGAHGRAAEGFVFTIMENITANEVAGLGVGAFLLAAALATPKVDAFIARGQRRDLKLCMECGGVTRIPCVRCKSRGTLNQNIFSFEGSSKPATCPACRGKAWRVRAEWSGVDFVRAKAWLGLNAGESAARAWDGVNRAPSVLPW